MTGLAVLRHKMAVGLEVPADGVVPVAARGDLAAGFTSSRRLWPGNYNSRRFNKNGSPSLKKRQEPSSRRFSRPTRCRCWNRLARHTPVKAVPVDRVMAGVVRAVLHAVRAVDPAVRTTKTLRHPSSTSVHVAAGGV